ncbi:MAG TPA: glutathione S-transferase [Gammaproteobacteria bacterium]|jgi:glutathione S-transferase|uniref:glutathione S-transferase family protein n=1 Tax=Immundisolibacter sp. TaxID=1934948 RepID=UPI000E87A423|nr:glutathione S-transferase [Gammaproteobacteria bacterium]HCZ47757.1 glutathione S-transferase [Gammaproteobacteria bacterium]MCH77195.1 glutathione S-transferase [Gammaproteobacteria bacterium]
MTVLFGAPLSPFVRKVRVALAHKNLPYDLQPVMPGSDDPAFRRLSPLGKVPAFSDDQVGLADSSVICAYLEKRHPSPALLPADPAAYATALWLEEYADSVLFHICTEGVFFERIVKPHMRGVAPDEAKVAAALADLPGACDYLEAQCAAGHLGGDTFTLGDIAVATQFANLGYGGEQVDAARWPLLAQFLQDTLARPAFADCLAEEKALMGG